MDEKSVRPKRIGNHYIPPPARKQGVADSNEITRHKERPLKTSENRGVKLCNDSSLLFRESSDKVKEKTKRSRRSKRSTKKADAENASLPVENDVESKLSSNVPGFADRITNFHSETGSDPFVALEKASVKAVQPLTGLENLKQCHPVEFSPIDSHEEEDKLMTSLRPPHSTDQDVICNTLHTPSDQDATCNIAASDCITEEVAYRLHSLTIVISSDTSQKNELELPTPLCSIPDDTHVTENAGNQLLDSFNPSDGKIEDLSSEDSQSTTIVNDPTSELDSRSPGLSLPVDYLINISDDARTSSKESVYTDCEDADFAIKNDSSSGTTEIKDSQKESDPVVSSDLTNWNETNNNSQIYSLEDGDWETIYDDQGEFLLPSNTGSVKSKTVVVSKSNVEAKSSDPKQVDDDDKPHESSSIIEIYGFSEELKTSDILAAFGDWVHRGFNLKWVDNTHALGIFPSPTLAEEVLGSNLPLVKVRPISQGTSLSQERARTLVLPSSLRPKTCTALARRLVSGALGLKVNVTPEERAAERELLREAREKKKLVSKLKDAAWEGNFPSLES